MRAMKLFFVIPVYNEQPTLADLARGIFDHSQGHDARICFVDDGSTDGSGSTLRALADGESRIGVVHFRANFGKTAALAAGFHHIPDDTDVVFTMDGDLQDDPAEIPRLLAKLEEGYDFVSGWKQNRQDPWHKTLPSALYNGIIARLFRLKLHDTNSGFKAMRAPVISHLPLHGEMHRMMAVFAQAQGYRVTETPVQHHPRRFGKSHYGIERFARGALDVATTWFLTRHGQAPGHFFGFLGGLALALGLAGGAAGLLALMFSPWWLGGASHHTQQVLFPALLAWLVLSAMAACTGAVLCAAGLLGELWLHHQPPGHIPFSPPEKDQAE